MQPRYAPPLKSRSLLRQLGVVYLCVIAGCGPKMPVNTGSFPPTPPPPPPQLSWRERIQQAVNTLGDNCYPGDSTGSPDAPNAPVRVSLPQSSGAVEVASIGKLRLPMAFFLQAPKKRAISDIDSLSEISDIERVQFRKDTSDLIVIGPPAEPGKGLKPDDWLAVVRAVTGPEGPGVTIDPGPDPSHMLVRYFGGIEHTHVGNTFFEADRTLKLLSTGFDNKTCAVWPDRPPQIPTEIDLMNRDIDDSSLNDTGKWHRYWFEPSDVPVETETTDRAATMKLPDDRLVVKDESIPPGDRRRSSMEFSAAVTRSFLPMSAKVKAFAELQKDAGLVALAKWIRDNRLPVERSWIDGVPEREETVAATPSITVMRATLRDRYYLRYGIHGGVDFQKDNLYRSDLDSRRDVVTSSALSAEPRGSKMWDFTAAGGKYRAVRLHYQDPIPLRSNWVRWQRLTANGLPQPGIFRLTFPASKFVVENATGSALTVAVNGPIVPARGYCVLPGFDFAGIQTCMGMVAARNRGAHQAAAASVEQATAGQRRRPQGSFAAHLPGTDRDGLGVSVLGCCALRPWRG